MLIDGHYGLSSTFNSAHEVDSGDGCVCLGTCSECPNGGDDAYVKPYLAPSTHDGAVYSVVGSSSKASCCLTQHPVMITGFQSIGSMVLDVDGAHLDGTWIERGGLILDRFTLVKGDDADLDGDLDGADNCRFVANGDQSDLGGLLGFVPDGTGDGCQCGDLTGDGKVDAGDVSAVQLCLAGVGPCGPLCDADGNTHCQSADLTALAGALSGTQAAICRL